MKTLLRRMLRRLDLDLVRTHTTEEGHLSRLLAALKINVVFDVGAHFGEYARLLREIGYRGRIVSFEPVGASYARLCEAMQRDPNWQGHQCALGPEPGWLPINVTAASDLASFLAPSPEAGRWFGGASAVARQETVRMERLDQVGESGLAGIASPRVFLKLDTQGFDQGVLRGAGGIMGLVMGMQTEIAIRPLYDGVPLFPENVRPFLEYGFESTGLFAVSRESDRVAALEYNLMLRRAESHMTGI